MTHNLSSTATFVATANVWVYQINTAGEITTIPYLDSPEDEEEEE